MGRKRKDVMDKYADAEYMRLIGARITAAREARMLTLAELAAKLPISAGCAAICAGLNFAAALPGTAEERHYARKVGRELRYLREMRGWTREELRYLREMRGWTREELAEKSGIDEKLIARAELGDQAWEREKKDENKN